MAQAPEDRLRALEDREDWDRQRFLRALMAAGSTDD